MEIAHSGQSGVCDNHHLSTTTNLMASGITEGLNNNLSLLADIVWMKLSE